MINKEQIEALLNRYLLNKNEFIVLSGSALVLYGIKDETYDIDVAVSKEYFEKNTNAIH